VKLLSLTNDPLQAGAGYLNDWNFDDKLRPAPSAGKSNRQFVNERED